MNCQLTQFAKYDATEYWLKTGIRCLFVKIKTPLSCSTAPIILWLILPDLFEFLFSGLHLRTQKDIRQLVYTTLFWLHSTLLCSPSCPPWTDGDFYLVKIGRFWFSRSLLYGSNWGNSLTVNEYKRHYCIRGYLDTFTRSGYSGHYFIIHGV